MTAASGYPDAAIGSPVALVDDVMAGLRKTRVNRDMAG